MFFDTANYIFDGLFCCFYFTKSMITNTRKRSAPVKICHANNFIISECGKNFNVLFTIICYNNSNGMIGECLQFTNYWFYREINKYAIRIRKSYYDRG